MIGMLRLVTPWLFVAYFLFKARKDRLFLLGIPFLQFMKYSIFFEDAKPFWTPGRFDPNVLVLLWLAAVWLVVAVLRRGDTFEGGSDIGPFGPKRLLSQEMPLLGLFALLVVNVGRTAVAYGEPGDTASEAVSVICLLVGYVLVRGIIAHTSTSVMLEFIKALVVVDTFAAVLYILHQGFGIPIYDVQANSEAAFGGETFSRVFWVMPPLLYLALAYGLSAPKWGLWTWFFVVVTAVALFVSLNRSSVIIVALMVLATVVIRATRAGRLSSAVKSLVLAAVLTGMIWLATMAFFPSQMQFLSVRFSTLLAAPSEVSNNNMLVRWSWITMTWGSMDWSETWIGAGFVSAAQDLRVPIVNQWTADTVWVSVLFRLGLVGIALILVMHYQFFVASLKLATDKNGEFEVLGWLFVLMLPALIMEGGVSWTFMDPDRYTLGFWYLAFLAPLIARHAGRRVDVEADDLAPAARVVSP